MDIQDLGAIGEFISSVAIVITLIFLTIETRRSRNATQQSNRQARHRIRTDINLASAVSPQLCEIMFPHIPEHVFLTLSFHNFLLPLFHY